MTTVRLLRSAIPRTPWRPHPKAQLVDEAGNRLVLPFAPVGGTLAGLGPEWTQVARDGGRTPLLVLAAKRLAVLTLAAQLADTRNPDASQEGVVYVATAMARQARRVTLTNYGILVGNAWRITDLSLDVERRQPGTNAVTAGILTVELTAASDAVVRVGSTSGGAKAPTKPAARTITAKAGETPAALATRALGDPNRVVDLLEANGLRDPRRITAGTILTVPDP